MTSENRKEIDIVHLKESLAMHDVILTLNNEQPLKKSCNVTMKESFDGFSEESSKMATEVSIDIPQQKVSNSVTVAYSENAGECTRKSVSKMSTNCKDDSAIASDSDDSFCDANNEQIAKVEGCKRKRRYCKTGKYSKVKREGKASLISPEKLEGNNSSSCVEVYKINTNGDSKTQTSKAVPKKCLPKSSKLNEEEFGKILNKTCKTVGEISIPPISSQSDSIYNAEKGQEIVKGTKLCNEVDKKVAKGAKVEQGKPSKVCGVPKKRKLRESTAHESCSKSLKVHSSAANEKKAKKKVEVCRSSLMQDTCRMIDDKNCYFSPHAIRLTEEEKEFLINRLEQNEVLSSEKKLLTISAARLNVSTVLAVLNCSLFSGLIVASWITTCLGKKTNKYTTKMNAQFLAYQSLFKIIFNESKEQQLVYLKELQNYLHITPKRYSSSWFLIFDQPPKFLETKTFSLSDCANTAEEETVVDVNKSETVGELVKKEPDTSCPTKSKKSRSRTPCSTNSSIDYMKSNIISLEMAFNYSQNEFLKCSKERDDLIETLLSMRKQLGERDQVIYFQENKIEFLKSFALNEMKKEPLLTNANCVDSLNESLNSTSNKSSSIGNGKLKKFFDYMHCHLNESVQKCLEIKKEDATCENKEISEFLHNYVKNITNFSRTLGIAENTSLLQNSLNQPEKTLIPNDENASNIISGTASSYSKLQSFLDSRLTMLESQNKELVTSMKHLQSQANVEESQNKELVTSIKHLQSQANVKEARSTHDCKCKDFLDLEKSLKQKKDECSDLGTKLQQSQVLISQLTKEKCALEIQTKTEKEVRLQCQNVFANDLKCENKFNLLKKILNDHNVLLKLNFDSNVEDMNKNRESLKESFRSLNNSISKISKTVDKTNDNFCSISEQMKVLEEKTSNVNYKQLYASIEDDYHSLKVCFDNKSADWSSKFDDYETKVNRLNSLLESKSKESEVLKRKLDYMLSDINDQTQTQSELCEKIQTSDIFLANAESNEHVSTTSKDETSACNETEDVQLSQAIDKVVSLFHEADNPQIDKVASLFHEADNPQIDKVASLFHEADNPQIDKVASLVHEADNPESCNSSKSSKQQQLETALKIIKKLFHDAKTRFSMLKNDYVIDQHKISHFSSCLSTECSEVTRQYDLQLAMYLSTADRYREQQKRIEKYFN